MVLDEETLLDQHENDINLWLKKALKHLHELEIYFGPKVNRYKLG